MYKIIALIGKAGSGKDTMLHQIVEANPDFHEIISCTTRPQREGEVHGVNYFYLTPEQFGDKIIHNEMLEATYFNDQFYGTSYESLRSDAINVGVFNPTGVESLLTHKDVEVEIFYIEASAKTRLIRQLNRENNPDIEEIIRRYKADEEDFFELNFSYKIIPNEFYEDLQAGMNTILETIQS